MDIDPEPGPVAPVYVPPPTTSGQVRQFPNRYQDFLPNSQTQVPHMPAVPVPDPPVAPSPPSSPTPSPEPDQPDLQELQTEPDDFGLFQIYPIHPATEPDANSNLDDVCDAPGLETSETPLSGRWWDLAPRLLQWLKKSATTYLLHSKMPQPFI